MVDMNDSRRLSDHHDHRHHPSNCELQHMDPHYSLSSQASPSTWRVGSDVGKCSLSSVMPRVNAQISCNIKLIDTAISHLRGKKLVLMGDSIMLQQWLATILLLSSSGIGLSCPDLRGIYLAGWDGIPHFWCTHTNAPSSVRMSLCFAHNYPELHELAPRLKELVVSGDVNKHDVVLLNTGIWHPTDFDMTKGALDDLHNLMDDPSALSTPISPPGSPATGMPRIFWRETAPQHFPTSKCPEGDDSQSGCGSMWNLPVDEQSRCAPCPKNISQSFECGGRGVERQNRVAQEHIAAHHRDSPKSNLPIVPIWQRSIADWEYHLGVTTNRNVSTILDCTHWCLPSTTVNSWTLQLFAMLTGGKQC
uniref:Uncharacterized protein n=1 Tax=Haptolina ericina TaxID=156174 RepID=A0A7S3B551_9EUKA|mmetsp:Transcript_51457/g.115570  ORF Transcript_51457/g.115570 Transcript_51457/m.115570 type:complete len:363 (+) Transcript_51457:66-1154(+)